MGDTNEGIGVFAMNSAQIHHYSLNTNNSIQVDLCPACGDKEFLSEGALSGNSYQFGTSTIDFSVNGIELRRCTGCGLFYKDIVPTMEFLHSLVGKEVSTIWNEEYDYCFEKTVVMDLLGTNELEILDIGASEGELLAAFSDVAARSSALDIVQYPKLLNRLRGEFIHGFLDEVDLSWSKKPYDVITAFDVFEHFYHPKVALDNLHNFLKSNGLIVIETGDANSTDARILGVNNWWYVNLLEHHIFWTEESIRKFAERNGFEVLKFVQKRHKTAKLPRTIRGILELLKSSLYRVAPSLYKGLLRIIGRCGRQPRNILSCDHMQIILRKS